MLKEIITKGRIFLFGVTWYSKLPTEIRENLLHCAGASPISFTGNGQSRAAPVASRKEGSPAADSLIRWINKCIYTV